MMGSGVAAPAGFGKLRRRRDRGKSRGRVDRELDRPDMCYYASDINDTWIPERPVTTSSRFAVSLHILTILESQAGGPVTSEYIARSVNTNSGVVRRLLSMLHRAGLVVSQLGAGGGALLAKPASQIRLIDVYRAVEPGPLFGMHRSPPNPDCPVGAHIQAALRTAMGRAEAAFEDELAETRLSDIARSVGARGKSRTRAVGAG
jgi:Rrf2 family protein